MALTKLTTARARWTTFTLKVAKAVSRSLYDKLTERGISVKDFGAVGDGVTDDSEAIQLAWTYAHDQNLPLYVPSGIYLCNKVGRKFSLENATKDIVVYGDGVSSIIKMGDNSIQGDFQSCFYVTNAAGSSINVTFENLQVDMNARGNPLPVGADPYVWEHCHAFWVYPTDTNGIDTLVYNNLVCKDPVADAWNLSGNAVRTIRRCVASGLISMDRTRVRSDFTVTCDYDTITLTNCVLPNVEVETNSTNATNEGSFTLSNCVINSRLDLMYKSYEAHCTVDNCIIKGTLHVDGFHLKVDNTSFVLDTGFRLVGSGTSYSTSLVFSDCTFRESSSYVANSKGYSWVETSATSPMAILFKDCEFYLSSASTYVHYNINAAANGIETVFRDCEFHGDTATCDIYVRSGKYSFIGNTYHRTTGYCIWNESTTATSVTNELLIKDNHVENTNVSLYRPAAAGNTITIWMSGNTAYDGVGAMIDFTRYDKIAAPRGSGSLLDFKVVDTGESDGVPTTGKHVTGHRVWFMSPVLGSVGATCTASGEPGTWVTF